MNVWLQWGLCARVHGMWLTVAELNLRARAVDRVLQWFSSQGNVSKVRTITRSTSLSPMERGVPGQGSSSMPSQPLRRKRRLQLPTVARVVDCVWATA